MEIVPCDNLEEAIERYRIDGYRLDMIFPADSPREARVSRGGEHVVLSTMNLPVGNTPPPLPPSDGRWRKGRAGMMYRDLLPDRMDGKVAVSQIRITEGGPVADYVHYHKIEFQLIYCLRGRIRVVYEDQGEPFWLEIGDCVLQPPEIRHRVLESDAGAEVIEVSSPAEHETWVDHELCLPTKASRPNRKFGGQRFVRHVSSDRTDGICNTGISAATAGRFDVRISRHNGVDQTILLNLEGIGANTDAAAAETIAFEIPI